ncbi:restriction endonuclease subunit S [Vagococcus fluvialis]|uniref:restriction endonuclease subunit S n=1 Tax=Vagococcus fluvialis TaxID=2738 RepID=UPI003B58D916
MSKNIPQLRFEGFTYDWKQRKLGTLAKFSKGKGYTKGDLIEDGVPIILYGRLYTKYQTIISDIDTYVDALENSVLSEGSEVIVPSSGETSEDIARAAVVDNKGVILGGDLNIIKPSKKLESSFLALTISNGEAQKELMKKAQGNSVVHLYNNDLKEVKLFYPDNLEQTKIGNFFKTLDDTITLHQRKLDLLKEQKKGYLQKMFPKNGAKVPELRFAGFADDWEERKLGDVLSERNDQTPETNEYPLMSFVQGKGVTPKGERYNRSFLVKDSEKKYKKTELGDFIYSSNNLETGSIGFNRTGKAVISPVYSIFKSKKSRESQFIGIMSARKDFISKMVRFRQGVVYGQWRIHESDFLNIDMKMPNDKEQQLIISFFENIDKTIALHQRKLDLFKEQKKGFLQKMFV